MQGQDAAVGQGEDGLVVAVPPVAFALVVVSGDGVGATVSELPGLLRAALMPQSVRRSHRRRKQNLTACPSRTSRESARYVISQLSQYSRDSDDIDCHPW